MHNMQSRIDKVLNRKRKIETEDQPQVKKISNIHCHRIPSFSITDVDTFLKFEKDLSSNHLFDIAFHRIITTCNISNKKDNVLSNCLNAIISRDMLKHFKWESKTDQFHSLSKCPNFIYLLHKVVVALKNESVKFSRSQIETFLRFEISKESKPPIQIPKLPNLNQNHIVRKLSTSHEKVTLQMPKLPKFTMNRNYIIREPLTRIEKVYPNRLIIRKIPQRNLNIPNISSIGIDEADLQSEITTTEIDLNISKGSEKYHEAVNDNDDNEIDDNESGFEIIHL